MIISVTYVRTDIINSKFYFTHRLLDKAYDKTFAIGVESSLGPDDQHAAIVNGILDFVYHNYRGTSECPFRNIKTLYDNGGLNYADDAVRRTSFYNKYSKVMDKILRPVAITPRNEYYSVSTGTPFFIDNITYPQFTYGTAATTNTITLTYPVQYHTFRIQ